MIVAQGARTARKNMQAVAAPLIPRDESAGPADRISPASWPYSFFLFFFAYGHFCWAFQALLSGGAFPPARAVGAASTAERGAAPVELRHRLGPSNLSAKRGPGHRTAQNQFTGGQPTPANAHGLALWEDWWKPTGHLAILTNPPGLRGSITVTLPSRLAAGATFPTSITKKTNPFCEGQWAVCYALPPIPAVHGGLGGGGTKK